MLANNPTSNVLRAVVLAALIACDLCGQVGKIPEGFTLIFNGKDTTGWHWSRTVHHGTTAEAVVENGVLVLKPKPYGQGGLFLTDKTYKDFELYLETLPDPNYNSGIFLRSTEGGGAYQIELVRPGAAGAWLGEMIKRVQPQYIGEQKDVNTLWKDGEWNSMRVRMVGEAPHATMWINGTQLWELQEPENLQIAGLYGGHIGLQLHWSANYTGAPGGGGGRPWLVMRFRNIAIKELK